MDQATTAKSPGFAKRPDYKLEFVQCPKRVRVMVNGKAIADSTQTRLMLEGNHVPVYYFPRADVRMDALHPTDNATHCPYKGDASYWTVEVGGKQAENAVWSYQDPYQEMAEIKDYMAFYWNRVDRWLEEDEEVFVHARDPYKRIDIIASHRPVRIVLGGRTVAESRNAMWLFETGLPVRYYLAKADVDLSILTPTQTRTACPYKGDAIYWSAEIDSTNFEDVVWSYPAPIPEAAKVRDLLCFFNEKVDDIFVDGAQIPKVKTKWSPA